MMRAAAVAIALLVACGDDRSARSEPANAADPAPEPLETPTPEPAEPVPVEPAPDDERAAPLEPTLVERDGIHLTRLLTTSEIVDQGPGEPRQVYTKGVDEKAYCYFELDNPERVATRVTLSWVDEAGESPNPPSTIEVPAQAHFANYRYTGIPNRRLGELTCLIQLDGREQLGRAPIRIVE